MTEHEKRATHAECAQVLKEIKMAIRYTRGEFWFRATLALLALLFAAAIMLFL